MGLASLFPPRRTISGPAPSGRNEGCSASHVYGRAGYLGGMDARQRELLTGMGNCFEACDADFEGTVEMVSGARDRTPQDVRATLAEMRTRFAADPDYQQLRARLPPEFPL
jgi:hypothetical protein